MKKKNIIKKNEEFNTIIKNNKPLRNKYFLIFIANNKFNNYRFGISVSKKVGNAVTRNKIKRRVKNILDHHINMFKNGYDCIIIINKNVLELTYLKMEELLVDILNKSKIVN